MIIKFLAHIIGFLGGAIVGVLATLPMTFLAIFLLGAASRSGKLSGGRYAVLLVVFLLSGAIAVLMVFVSALIISLFKIEPSWVLVLVYGIALLMYMQRPLNYPSPWMKITFNGGTLCGIVVGGILFLTF